MERIGCRRRPRPSGKGGRWYNPPGMVLARYSVQTTGGIGKERPLRGGDLLIECLKAQGVRAVFGMPGTQNLEIYDSLLRCGEGSVDHYLVRHEYAATQMADGFARSTGEVGVALTVPGPGASNASTGILEAYTDCVPVLLITGQSDSRFYDKHQAKMFHGLDQMTFFKPITKYRAIARTVRQIPEVVESAFKAMRSGRPGPAVLEFPMDVVRADGDPDIPGYVRGSRGPAAADGDLRAAAREIDRAGRPVCLVGSAVIHAGAQAELRRLVEKIQAPVVVTRCAKGALDENHPLALRGSNGYLAWEALKVADATLAIGCRFTSIDTNNWRLKLPQPLIQLDEDEREIGSEYPCELGVVGDLKATLQGLVEEVERRPRRWERALEIPRARFAAQRPLPLLGDIRQVLPDDGILSVDVHSIGYSAFDEYPVDRPRTFLYPCIGVALGYGYPAAVGAKVGCPDKPVVCFSGDGGFLMGMAELATAVRYGIPLVAVVVNDQALTAIKGSQRKNHQGRVIGTDLTNPNFAEMARSFGAAGKRVRNLRQFKGVLEEALAARRPTVIEVPMRDDDDQLTEAITWLRSHPLRRLQGPSG